MQRIRQFIAREWAAISTKLGLLLTVVSTIAPQFAQFDTRFAYVGAGAGVLLILYRGKADG